MIVVDGVTVDDRELHERLVRSFGPGGQNAGNRATAVGCDLISGRRRCRQRCRIAFARSPRDPSHATAC
jgi:hypothetical protein